jgi:hypothetical protein
MKLLNVNGADRCTLVSVYGPASGPIGSGKSTVAEHACKYLEERTRFLKVIRVRVNEEKPIDQKFLEEMKDCKELYGLNICTDARDVRKELENIRNFYINHDRCRRFIFLFNNTSKLSPNCQQSLVLHQLGGFIELLYSTFGDLAQFVVTSPESILQQDCLHQSPVKESCREVQCEILDEHSIARLFYRQVLKSANCNNLALQDKVKKFIDPIDGFLLKMKGNPMLVQNVVAEFEKILQRKGLDLVRDLLSKSPQMAAPQAEVEEYRKILCGIQKEQLRKNLGGDESRPLCGRICCPEKQLWPGGLERSTVPARDVISALCAWFNEHCSNETVRNMRLPEAAYLAELILGGRPDPINKDSFRLVIYPGFRDAVAVLVASRCFNEGLQLQIISLEDAQTILLPTDGSGREGDYLLRASSTKFAS